MSHTKTNMSISLTRDLKDYVKKRTRTAHYGTPSDYMRSLIRDDMRRAEQERLERELLKGLHSGKGIRVTQKELTKLRTEVRSRINKLHN